MSRRSATGALGSNPYVVGPPVYGKGPFFGRDKDLPSARGPASRGEVVIVEGGRRVGKSSFLLHVQATAPKTHLHCALEPTPEGGVKGYLTEICAVLEVDPKGILRPKRSQDAQIAALLEAAEGALKSKRLVCYLDAPSAEAGAEGAALLGALAKASPRVSALIACPSAEALVALVPALGEARMVTLGLLSPKAARALIKEPVKGELDFEEEAVLHLMDLSGRHPSILQALCFETFERVRARPVDAVGMMEVVAAAKGLEAQGAALGWLWEGQEPPLPLLLSAMAEAAPIDRSIFRGELESVLSNYHLEIPPEAVGEGLKLLEERGLVRRESKDRVAFNIELLRRWIIRNQPMADQPEARLDAEAAQAKAQRHLEEGREALLMGRPGAALEHLTRAVDVRPDWPEARVELARAHGELGAFAAAVAAYPKEGAPRDKEARAELGEIYLRWAEALREGGEPEDDALAGAAELLPDHPEVLRWRRQEEIERARRALKSARTWEALKALSALSESLGAEAGEAMASLKGDAVIHLEGALIAGAGRKGRAVSDLVALLRQLYPEDPRPGLLFAEFLIGDGEALEPSSPPAALSHYRRAGEALAGIDAVPEALARRLESGRRRVAALFLRAQEASLEQLLVDGQFDAAEQLARELVEEHSSEAAQKILERLSERRDVEERYEGILQLMARDGRGEARRLARDLATASPDFMGSDGRTAAQLLEELGEDAEEAAASGPLPGAPRERSAPGRPAGAATAGGAALPVAAGARGRRSPETSTRQSAAEQIPGAATRGAPREAARAASPQASPRPSAAEARSPQAPPRGSHAPTHPSPAAARGAAAHPSQPPAPRTAPGAGPSIPETQPPGPAPAADPRAGESRGAPPPRRPKGPGRPPLARLPAEDRPPLPIPPPKPPRGGFAGWVAFAALLVAVVIYLASRPGGLWSLIEQDGEPEARLAELPRNPVPVPAFIPPETPAPVAAAPITPTPAPDTPTQAPAPPPAPPTPRPLTLPRKGEPKAASGPDVGAAVDKGPKAATGPASDPASARQGGAPAPAASMGDGAAKAVVQGPGPAGAPSEVEVASLPPEEDVIRILTPQERAEAQRHLMEARQNAQRGAYRSAAESYERSVAIDPSQANIFQDMGLLYYALKDYPRAEVAFRRSLNLAPNVVAQFDLGKVLRAQGKYIQARGAFEAALADPALPKSMAEDAARHLESLPSASALADPAPTPSPTPAATAPTRESGIWESEGAPAVKLFQEPPATAPAP